MKFKDLKVGDTLYIRNPKEWYKPIKKTIGSIEKHDPFLDFYDNDDDWIGCGLKNDSVYSERYFADFKAFKQFTINYRKKIFNDLNYEMHRLEQQIRLANADVEIANEMQDED
ncbi:MAG: hypothetical protein MJZ25_09100 [Fibrobacter sp.]|nr:hypothetical protein [Fibrobacter sp.]